MVQIEDRLRRIRRFDPMYMVRQAGVKDLYECWLVNEQFVNPNPACLICTSLPAGYRPAEKLEGDTPVVFVGYFFKKFRYQDARGETRDVPLLIGHLRLKSTAAASRVSSEWTGWILPLLVIVLWRYVTTGVVPQGAILKVA